MKREGAFVLAEVLVVSVIVAILAAIAVPLYSEYVRKQKIETVQSLAQTAAVAANAYYRRHGDFPDSTKLGLFLPVQGKYLVSFTNADTTVTIKDASDPTTIYSTVKYK